jgi:4-oxalocrotonate tautomerase
MPHVIIKMYAGRSAAEKTDIAAAVAKAVMESAKSPDQAISVSIEDIAPADWVETVYKPDIVGKPDELFKKPGYDPL